MEEVNGFKRDVWFSPAWDKRNVDGKNYGIHGVEITFVLSKDGQGVTFQLFTHWHLPHVQDELNSSKNGRYSRYCEVPMGAFIGVHHNQPQYDGQEPSRNCKVTGGNCWGDGSGLLAEEYMATLIAEGGPGIWARLEKQYASWILGEAA